MHDPLGDRMKTLERQSAGQAFDVRKPIYARIDGRGFSRFTTGMQRPFDARMTNAMIQTAKRLLETNHASAVYVQSDEISLVWAERPDGEHFFGGKPQKMSSILASFTTAAFTRALLEDREGLNDWVHRLPHFDARVVEMPSRKEAAEMFAWRGQDARRNGINQAARSLFSHKELQFKGTREIRRMMAEVGHPTSGYPRASMNGTLLRRVLVERALDPEELARIPEKHRPSPDQTFARHKTTLYDEEHPGRISNLEQVIFDGADPEVVPRRDCTRDDAA